MYIFIMRHGEAANVEGQDSLRPLTQQGILEANKMGFWLTQYNKRVRLVKVFVSPYVRAQQSCVNVLSAIKSFKEHNEIIAQTLDFITPSGNVQQVHDFIDGLNISNAAEDAVVDNLFIDHTPAILLVSHMPFVSYLVGELTNSSNMPIFSTGSIAIIDYNVQTMQGRLVDIVSPDNVNI